MPASPVHATETPGIGVSVEALTHRFETRGGTVTALQSVDLTIPKGEFHCLLGPSGCGKSTLLYLIGGFLKVQTGAVRTARGTVTKPGPDRGVVFQNFVLFPWKTVLQNITYGMENLGISKTEREARARHLISLVHLDGFQNHFPAQLSGGMQQRAAIARTLAIEPDILLMDEPFGALDAQTRRIMQQELLAIWRGSGKTVIFVTHDVQEAVLLGSTISVMSARPGRISETVKADFNVSDDSHLERPADFSATCEHVWRLITNQTLRPAP